MVGGVRHCYFGAHHFLEVVGFGHSEIVGQHRKVPELFHYIRYYFIRTQPEQFVTGKANGGLSAGIELCWAL